MSKYDTIIIGAGMSGLAAGIRLAYFGKKVLIVEKHTIAGGLNSYYSRNGYIYDVGLHAMTNYSLRKNKHAPLNKLLRQLRLKRDDLHLIEQRTSVIQFPDTALHFSNNIDLLIQEIHDNFPSDIDGFNALVEHIRSYDALSLENSTYCSARSVLKTFLKEPVLVEMLMCPLMYYGSAWEHDMDFSQFAIMFEALFLEGFCRPENGVLTVIKLLKDKYLSCNGELRFKAAVQHIITENDKATGVMLRSGETIYADTVLSSAGICETYELVDCCKNYETIPGTLSFTEVILRLNEPMSEKGYDNTIMFHNNSSVFAYECPQETVSLKSSVICCPDNFQYTHAENAAPLVRITNIANSDHWESMSSEQYRIEKSSWLDRIIENAAKAIPLQKDDIIFTDMFTPKTVRRYTGHIHGAVYGSPDKIKDGRTMYEDLYICGTDQGFLGIIGSMLSGISIANKYLLT
jgi:phytoene dehydrogenase-like protein